MLKAFAVALVLTASSNNFETVHQCPAPEIEMQQKGKGGKGGIGF